jgi:hypothetical protein
MSIGEITNNVVDRLEEYYDLDRGEDALNQTYFSSVHDVSGAGITIAGTIVLYCEVDDTIYKKCANPDQCDSCSTNCQELTEDDIFEICRKRVEILAEGLSKKKIVV